MKSIFRPPLLSLACLMSFAAKAAGDMAPQPRMDFTKGLQGTFNADWQGVGARTYFMQFSMDLRTWHYAPFIDFGDGEHNRGIESDTDKFFLRLHYGDFPGINSLDDAMNADFDGDGLSNIFEVTFGYNPFDPTSTVDGADASLDPDGDGMGNNTEVSKALNPMGKDNPEVLLEITAE